MIKITVNASRTYDVIMEHGLLAKAGSYICDALGITKKDAECSTIRDCNSEFAKSNIYAGEADCDDYVLRNFSVSDGKKICIVTDSNVDKLYGQPEQALWTSLAEAGFDVYKYVFPGGEDHKNMETITDILEYLAANNFTRSDVLLALGGGITGDVTGFAAATFLRGVEFIQVPTSLLAVVDSSVGGKTGVNLSSGKNLAGAFWQPSLVLFDPDVLDTLTDELKLDGIAETVKAGIIADPNIISMSTMSRAIITDSTNCMNTSSNICNSGSSNNTASACSSNHSETLTKPGTHTPGSPVSCDTDFLAKLAAMAVEVKRLVVEEDERENGSRQLLNLGHTAAHAIEKCSNYRISHGHAVAMGTAIIAAAACESGWCDNDTYETILNTLRGFNFPLDCPYSAKELAAVALHDKKRRGGTITLVIPQQIGKCVLKTVDVDKLEDVFSGGLNKLKHRI